MNLIRLSCDQIASTISATWSASFVPQNEIKEYHAGQLVVRGNVHEGKRLYTAYQSPEFMRKKLLKGMNFIDCFQHALIQQDIWVVKTPPKD